MAAPSFFPTEIPRFALAVVAAVTAALLYMHVRHINSRARFAQLHGCRPIAKSLSKDPILGLDALLGTVRALAQHKMLERSSELYATYGNTFTLKELHRHIILTVEPENIKTVLSLRFSDYGLGHRLAVFKPLLGEGIFDTDGDHWASSRSLVRPSFTRDQVADLSSLENLFQDLMALLPHDGHTVVDLQPLFFCYTLDSATEFLFGHSARSLKTAPGEHAFAQAFQDAQRAVTTRGTLGWLSVFYRDRKASEGTRICREFAARLVDEAFRAVGKGEKQKAPQLEQDELRPRKYILAHELALRTTDRQRVLDELMNVLLAGRDTTASLLSNLFFVLAQNPTIWEKLRREVSDLGQRPPTYEELRSLEYVQCCLNECKPSHSLKSFCELCIADSDPTE
jgi:cytochrome P450